MAISTASGFKKKNLTQLVLPSGEEVLCKRGGIEVFLRSGKVPNSLMPLMKAALTGTEAVKQATTDLDVTPDTISEMFVMFDIVAVGVMVQPKCHSLPESEEDRKDDLLYVDEVELEDKQFLFQWAVGGTADVEKFRSESSALLAALQPSEEVPSSPLPPPEAQ